MVRVPDCRSGGCGFEPRRPRSESLLSVVDGRLFSLTGQALTTMGLVFLSPSPLVGFLSAVDFNLHGWPLVGATFGATGESLESSVPLT